MNETFPLKRHTWEHLEGKRMPGGARNDIAAHGEGNFFKKIMSVTARSSLSIYNTCRPHAAIDKRFLSLFDPLNPQIPVGMKVYGLEKNRDV